MTLPETSNMADQPRCFFEKHSDCDGQLVKAHLVPKQSIKRELYYRYVRETGMTKWDAREKSGTVAWDPRCWRWVCGGPTGIGGHHGQVDAKQIEWGPWPEDLLEFLAEYDLRWMAVAYV